jgi:hypothetical protein
MPFIGFSTRGRGDFSSLKILSLPQLKKSIPTSTISNRKITLDQIPLENQNQSTTTLLHDKRDLFKSFNKVTEEEQKSQTNTSKAQNLDPKSESNAPIIHYENFKGKMHPNQNSSTSRQRIVNIENQKTASQNPEMRHYKSRYDHENICIFKKIMNIFLHTYYQRL